MNNSFHFLSLSDFIIIMAYNFVNRILTIIESEKTEHPTILFVVGS